MEIIIVLIWQVSVCFLFLICYGCKTSLQQWFEYCAKGKKKNCPVCKQACSEENANRLYFQSIGDPNVTSLTQKPPDYEEDHWELQNEVKRLERKVLGLTSTLEKQLKDLKEVNAEVIVHLAITLTMNSQNIKLLNSMQLHHVYSVHNIFSILWNKKRIYMSESWSHEWHMSRSVSLSNILVKGWNLLNFGYLRMFFFSVVVNGCILSFGYSPSMFLAKHFRIWMIYWEVMKATSLIHQPFLHIRDTIYIVNIVQIWQLEKI